VDWLTSIVLACSLHLDDPVVLSIAGAFSQGNPLTVTNVAVDHLDPRDDRLAVESVPETPEAAGGLVARLVARGATPVVGLLPVLPEWAREFQKSSGMAFDACTNVEIATAKLSEFDHSCRAYGATPTTAARRQCTLQQFGRSVGMPALSRRVMLDLSRSVPVAVAADVTEPSSDLVLPRGGLSFPPPAPAKP
jgi:hypothetical protein